jgi:rRNA maturation RNase YbeY
VRINFNYQDSKYKIIDEEITKIWINKVIKKENKKLGELEYNFVTEKEILKTNQEFLNHDYFTDIITFDNSFVNIINGVIYISPDTVCTNACNFNVSYKDELYRVVIHGVMHLCGYRDRTESEKILMRKKENQYLHYLEEL